MPNYKGLPEGVRTPLRPTVKEIRGVERCIRKVIEDDARTEFGFKKVGEQWLTESPLARVVENIFPSEMLLRHHRPDWLDGLELDLFLPNRAVGIEYQAQQHFHPVKVWGGQSALEALQMRDERKRELCAGKGVRLIEFDCTEPFNEPHVR